MSDAITPHATGATPTRLPARHDLSRVHMVGVGGAGMSGLARILLATGSVVSGSDMKDSRVLFALRSQGAHLAVGHCEDNLMLTGELPTVVVTSLAAIPKTNPELQGAAARGIPVITRSDLLAELMRGSREVLFAGTHGKTSTTSMAVVAFQAAGVDPSFAIGGQLNKAGTNAHWGTGDIFIAEADESDASLLTYSPRVAVVTTVEPDHLDFFHTEQAYRQVFVDFADRVLPGGTVLVCLNDPGARALGEALVATPPTGDSVRVVGYGTAEAVAESTVPALVTVESISPHAQGVSQVRVTVNPMLVAEAGEDSQPLSVEFSLSLPGEHMALNACAALGAGVASGVDARALARGLTGFTGVRRRFELKAVIDDGPFAGTRIYDDYAHHPTEIAAVLRAARSIAAEGQPGPLVAVFQPHLYSRTMNFRQEFAEVLSAADQVIVCDVFPAREAPVEGVDGRVISDLVSAPVQYVPSLADVPEAVRAVCGPGAVVLTIGAGSVTVLGPEIARALAADADGGE